MGIIKYEKEIKENFNKYNFEGFIEKEVISYRWVFSNIDDARNFIPPYIINKNREIETPNGFALSFFCTKESGISRLKTITSNKPNLSKKLGTHIAEGKILTSDGISCEPNQINHFDLFEYDGNDLKASFTILEQII